MKKLIFGTTIFAASVGMSFGAALSLDGIDDHATFLGTGVPTGANSFTIGAWINPTTIPAGGSSGGTITFWGNEANNQANGFRMRGGDGVNHFFWSNDHAEVGVGDMLADTTGPNGDGWHHLTISYDGTTNNSTWYKNGVPIGTADKNRLTDPTVAAANYLIGKRLTGEIFHGFIDELSIWNVALDGATIAAGWNQPIDYTNPSISPFLVAYWDFENGGTDLAGGDNTATFQSGALVDVGANAPLIPEPTAGILGLFGLALILRRRR